MKLTYCNCQRAVLESLMKNDYLPDEAMAIWNAAKLNRFEDDGVVTTAQVNNPTPAEVVQAIAEEIEPSPVIEELQKEVECLQATAQILKDTGCLDSDVYDNVHSTVLDLKGL